MPTTLPESLAEKIIAEKIHEWEVSKDKARSQKTIEVHPFLALTRDFGCGEENVLSADPHPSRIPKPGDPSQLSFQKAPGCWPGKSGSV